MNEIIGHIFSFYSRELAIIARDTEGSIISGDTGRTGLPWDALGANREQESSWGECREMRMLSFPDGNERPMFRH